MTLKPSNPIQKTKLKLIQNIRGNGRPFSIATTPQNISPINIEFPQVDVHSKIKDLERKVDDFKNMNADLKENLRINKESLAALIIENGKLQ